MATGGKPRPRHRALFTAPPPFLPPEIDADHSAQEQTGATPLSQPNRSTPATPYDPLQQMLAFAALYQYTRSKPTIVVHSEVHRERSADAAQSSDASPFEFDEVLQLVLQRAEAITGANGVAIALAEDDGIVLRAAMGSMRPDVGTRIEPDSAFSGSCLRTAQAIICDDTEADSRVNLEACRHLGARSIAAVPISGCDDVIGLLELFSESTDAFTGTEVRNLSRLAELIASALTAEEQDRLAQFARAATNKLGAASTSSSETVAAKNAGTLPTTEEVTAAKTTLLSGLTQRQIAMALLVVGIAAAIALGIWIKSRRGTSHVPEQASTQNLASSRPPVGESANPPTPLASVRRPPSSAFATSRAIPRDISQLPRVTGLEHTSAADASTITLALDGAVRYQIHRLSSPDRIYVDLRDTQLAPSLSSGKPVDVGDAEVNWIRVAQPVQGTTRLVLQTNGAPNFSVNLETNPYRLIVEVRADRAKN